MRDARDAHARRLDQSREVQRRRFTFDRRIGGDDHFLYVGVQSREQLLQLELIGTDAVQRRQRSMENVIAAAELARPLDGEQIGHRLDDAEQLRVALGIGADCARILRGEIAARRAQAHFAFERRERLGQLARVLRRRLEDMKSEPLRGLLAHAGELREKDRESRDRIRCFHARALAPRRWSRAGPFKERRPGTDP